MSSYVEPRRARHRIEFVDGVEQLRIPYRRNWFVLIFLSFWLTGWTVGGGVAISAILSDFTPFLAFWLCGWAFGWVAAAGTVASQINGAEMLHTPGGDLEMIQRIGPFRRGWRYRGGEIRNLERTQRDWMSAWWMGGIEFPLLMRPRAGSLRFDYGADSLFLAASAEGSDADAILDWLARRLPRTATAGG